MSKERQLLIFKALGDHPLSFQIINVISELYFNGIALSQWIDSRLVTLLISEIYISHLIIM